MFKRKTLQLSWKTQMAKLQPSSLLSSCNALNFPCNESQSVSWSLGEVNCKIWRIGAGQKWTALMKSILDWYKVQTIYKTICHCKMWPTVLAITKWEMLLAITRRCPSLFNYKKTLTKGHIEELCWINEDFKVNTTTQTWECQSFKAL